MMNIIKYKINFIFLKIYLRGYTTLKYPYAYSIILYTIRIIS